MSKHVFTVSDGEKNSFTLTGAEKSDANSLSNVFDCWILAPELSVITMKLTQSLHWSGRWGTVHTTWHTPLLFLWSDTTGLEEQEREKRRQVMEKFQKAPFEEIAAHCESKVRNEWTEEKRPRQGVQQCIYCDCVLNKRLLFSRRTCCTTGWHKSSSLRFGKSPFF